VNIAGQDAIVIEPIVNLIPLSRLINLSQQDIAATLKHPGQMSKNNSSRQKSNVSKSYQADSEAFTLALFRNDHPSNDWYHGISLELKKELSYYWAQKRFSAGGNRNLLFFEIFDDLDSGTFPPIKTYCPDLSGDYYENILGLEHNYVVRGKYERAHNNYPPSIKNYRIENSNQRTMNVLNNSSLTMAQAFAMMAQAEWQKNKVDSSTSSQSTKVITFENTNGDFDTSINHSDNYDDNTLLIDVMKMSYRRSPNLFTCTVDERQFQMNLLLNNGTELPLSLDIAKVTTVKSIFNVIKKYVKST